MGDLIELVMSNGLLPMGAIATTAGVVLAVIGVLWGLIRRAFTHPFYAAPAKWFMMLGVVLIVPGLVLLFFYAVL